MFQLMYVSSASWPLDYGELNAILDESRRLNRASGVTGLLLHLNQGFLQILEGPKKAVLETFARIERDFRHIGARVLIQQDVPERLFGEWTMGFDRWSKDAPRTADVFDVTRDAIDNIIPPEKAAELAVLLRNFYTVHAGSYAA